MYNIKTKTFHRYPNIRKPENPVTNSREPQKKYPIDNIDCLSLH